MLYFRLNDTHVRLVRQPHDEWRVVPTWSLADPEGDLVWGRGRLLHTRGLTLTIVRHATRFTAGRPRLPSMTKTP